MKFLDKNFFNELMVEVVMRFKKHIFDDKVGVQMLMMFMVDLIRVILRSIVRLRNQGS